MSYEGDVCNQNKKNKNSKCSKNLISTKNVSDIISKFNTNSFCCCLPVVGKSCLGRAPAHIQGPEDRIVIATMEIISNGKKTKEKIQ